VDLAEWLKALPPTVNCLERLLHESPWLLGVGLAAANDVGFELSVTLLRDSPEARMCLPTTRAGSDRRAGSRCRSGVTARESTDGGGGRPSSDVTASRPSCGMMSGVTEPVSPSLERKRCVCQSSTSAAWPWVSPKSH
jgi:hypothetical protein